MMSIQHLSCIASLELLGQIACSSSEPNKKEPGKSPGLQTVKLCYGLTQ